MPFYVISAVFHFMCRLQFIWFSLYAISQFYVVLTNQCRFLILLSFSYILSFFSIQCSSHQINMEHPKSALFLTFVLLFRFSVSRFFQLLFVFTIYCRLHGTKISYHFLQITVASFTFFSFLILLYFLSFLPFLTFYCYFPQISVVHSN